MKKSWRLHHLGYALHAATKSKDPSRKVGAVIVGPDMEVRSTGFNDMARGVDDTIPSRRERPAKYLWTAHAEANAIYNAARVGTPTKGCSIVVQLFPCAACAVAIIQSGIVEVVCPRPRYDDETLGDSFRVSHEMLLEAGVSLIHEDFD